MEKLFTDTIVSAWFGKESFPHFFLAFGFFSHGKANKTSTHLIHVSLTTLPLANARVPLNLLHQKKNERRRRFYVSIPDDKSPVYVFGDVGSPYQKIYPHLYRWNVQRWTHLNIVCTLSYRNLIRIIGMCTSITYETPGGIHLGLYWKISEIPKWHRWPFVVQNWSCHRLFYQYNTQLSV